MIGGCCVPYVGFGYLDLMAFAVVGLALVFNVLSQL
jgi:hypothetical protein